MGLVARTNETIASLSSQNTDSSMRKGEYTLNTDSLCNSPAIFCIFNYMLLCSYFKFCNEYS